MSASNEKGAGKTTVRESALFKPNSIFQGNLVVIYSIFLRSHRSNIYRNYIEVISKLYRRNVPGDYFAASKSFSRIK